LTKKNKNAYPTFRIREVGLAPWLGVFERKFPYREEEGEEPAGAPVDVILFGLGRYGSHMARDLMARNLKVVGVDFDRQVVAAWQKEEFPARYGDAEDPEFPASLPLSQAKWVVSTIPQLDVNLSLLDALRNSGFSGRMAFTAHSRREAEILQESGADLILTPFTHAARQAAEILVEDTCITETCKNDRGPENPEGKAPHVALEKKRDER
jgi:Trk K+ transport system NAD-binding subunit